MMAMPMSSGFPAVPRPSPDDRELLRACRGQDAAAFRSFVVQHQRMVFALLSRMLGAGPEVEDLAQETFVRAYRAFPSFDPSGPAKVSTWLLTIATRLALDSRKRRRVAVQSIDEPGGEGEKASERAGSGPTPEAALERRQLGEALARAAESLPDDQRAALVLAELHGLSIEEIAAALEVPANTAKTRLFRAREKMRAALAADWRTS
jgi:RNA polymerase sigma-70 factor (ECF subfamily)